MKIHTAIKYLFSLSRIPDRNTAARWKPLCDAVAVHTGKKFPRTITLGVTGRDRSYACSVITAAMNASGRHFALCSFDVNVHPETALCIDGKAVNADDIAQTVTLIRNVIKSLAAAEPEKYENITVQEACLLTALTICVKADVRDIIVSFDPDTIPQSLVHALPPFSAVLVTAVSGKDADTLGIVLKSGLGKLISTPQDEKAHLSLISICAALNCSCNIIPRGEIEIGQLNYLGLGFSYRGFSAVAGTCFASMLGVPAAVVETLRTLSEEGAEITQKNIETAVAGTRFAGRGEMIAVNPLVVCTVCGVDDIKNDGVMRSDLSRIAVPYGRIVDIMIEGGLVRGGWFTSQLDMLADIGTAPGEVVVVLDEGQDPSEFPVPEKYTAAGGRIIFTDNITAGREMFGVSALPDPPEKSMLAVYGSAGFIREATRLINVRLHRGLDI